MNNKDWKEIAKLDKREKYQIASNIIMIIFCTATAILEKDFIWILCALLWGNIVVIEYCDSKLSKGKDVLLNFYERQNKWLWKELLEQTPRVVHLKNIKIPKHFTKPGDKKLKERRQYLKDNKRFKAPIIVDKNLTLVDGYTSYLIAKNYNKTSVIAHLKRDKKQFCSNCGVELTKENKYMDCMCMECKCGIDWNEK